MSDGSSRGWVRYTDGTVVDIGTLMGLPNVKVVGISDGGVVAGSRQRRAAVVSDLLRLHLDRRARDDRQPRRTSLVMDIARNGDMTGHIGARSYLWHDGKAIDLNEALDLDPADGFILTSGVLINDQGTIVYIGSYWGYETVVALVPDGAGCVVCLDGHLYEHEFPTGSLIDAGNTIVEGNPTELFADIVNNDDVARTVTVSFVGTDGQPLDDPRTMTVPAKSTQHTYIPFDTEGLAWKDGVDAGPIDLGIEIRDVSGNVVGSETFQTRVVPRPDRQRARHEQRRVDVGRLSGVRLQRPLRVEGVRRRHDEHQAVDPEHDRPERGAARSVRHQGADRAERVAGRSRRPLDGRAHLPLLHPNLDGGARRHPSGASAGHARHAERRLAVRRPVLGADDPGAADRHDARVQRLRHRQPRRAVLGRWPAIHCRPPATRSARATGSCRWTARCHGVDRHGGVPDPAHRHDVLAAAVRRLRAAPPRRAAPGGRRPRRQQPRGDCRPRLRRISRSCCRSTAKRFPPARPATSRFRS